MASEQYNIDLHVVEQQLLQTGRFTPLQWLLDSGLLPYGAYEQWRYGEIDNLQQAVACDSDALLSLLERCQRNAQALKLVDEAQTYYHWRSDRASHVLALSRNSTLRRLLAQRWIRPQDIPQLDLFMDSGATAAQNDLVQQLAGRADWNKAERAYARLCELAPNNPHLGGYETLVVYGKHISAHVAVARDSLLDEMSALHEEIVPLARELLREAARDYLARAWQRLAHCLPTAVYDPQEPTLHASLAWAQIPNWQRVTESIEATVEFHGHIDLLQRLAQAQYYSQQQEAALLLWACAFELAPEQAKNDIQAQPMARLRRHWQAFLDCDEDHPLSHFPAWLLLMEPGLASHVGNASHPYPSGEAFRAMRALLRTRARVEDEVAARRALQQVSPALLQTYLERL